jgi:hypothetical protein
VSELAQRRFIPREARSIHAQRPVAAAVDFTGRCGADALSKSGGGARSSRPRRARRILFRSIETLPANRNLAGQSNPFSSIDPFPIN